jgi:DNA-binding MarR family transcriptional regulator
MDDRKTEVNTGFLRDEELRRGIELMFFAYRDFTSDPDEILSAYGFGRAHHRVLHFVGRNPEISVAELLAILKITKQSLSRVLSQLVHEDYILQQKGQRDRRQRLLSLSEKGRALEAKLSRPQRARVAKAYQGAGPDAVAAFCAVMTGMINEDERQQVVAALDKP